MGRPDHLCSLLVSAYAASHAVMGITFCGDWSHDQNAPCALARSAVLQSALRRSITLAPGGRMRKLGCLLVLASLCSPAILAQEKNPVAAAIREALPGRGKNIVAA